MGLEINGNAPLNNGNSGQSINQIGRKVEKKSVFVMNKDGSQSEKIYENGKLSTTVIRYDKNNDGKYDDNEMKYVDQYYYNDDGTSRVKRFADKDGDGYNDTVTTYEFGKNGKLASEKTIYEEDINDVKNRFHLEYEIYNRSMHAHKDGMYMY